MPSILKFYAQLLFWIDLIVNYSRFVRNEESKRSSTKFLQMAVILTQESSAITKNQIFLPFVTRRHAQICDTWISVWFFYYTWFEIFGKIFLNDQSLRSIAEGSFEKAAVNMTFAACLQISFYYNSKILPHTPLIIYYKYDYLNHVHFF